MTPWHLWPMILLVPLTLGAGEKPGFEQDVIPTAKGDLRITFLGHGTLLFEFNGLRVHVDPVGRYADYSTLPKADVILVTHEHGDHLDRQAIETIRTPETTLILPQICSGQLPWGVVMNNGDVKEVKGLKIEAVPAYNVVHQRRPGQPYHPKGVGNGYVVTFGDFRVYVAGDTEDIPEMARFAPVDCAFLPMNLPYTMTPEMVAKAARVLKPKILYPYHYGDTDTSRLLDLLRDSQIDVRIRRMK